MSTLTNTQIKDTYQGLLKLADSTTGITSNFQQIQDGLGNNTGIQIATNFLSAPNQPGFLNLKGDYYGLGFTAAGVAPTTNQQNVLLGYPFYDNGFYDYSAFTYNIITATTSTDTVEVSFYTSQMVDGIGLAPHIQVLSAQTLTVNSTGIKTTTLSSNLSFSGYGGGIYWCVMKISNSGVTPTVRFSGIPGQFTNIIGWYSSQLGLQYNSASTAIINTYRSFGATYGLVYSGLTTFNSSFTTGDVSTYSTTIAPPQWGWVLNTVK